jgi:RNA polymerase sigma factor (sigma-70 family)
MPYPQRLGGGVHAADAPARLDPRVEHALVQRAQAGDDAARDELIEAFLPSIGGVARIYRHSGMVERAELMQDGVVGLLRALERYDSDLDTPFWAYASWWVRQAMQQLVAELTRPVVLSDRAARQLARVRDVHRRHLQEHGEEPTTDDLARETGLSRVQVENLLVAARHPRALEEPVKGDEGTVGTFGDLLADPAAEEDYERVPRRADVETLPSLLETLTERERAIVSRRFGLGGRELTLREIGDGLGVSAERVRQIEQRALEKLREAVDGAADRPKETREAGRS